MDLVDMSNLTTTGMDGMDDGMGGMNRFNASGRPKFNFSNPNEDTTTAPILLGVGGGLIFLSLLLLSARLWSRIRPVAHLQMDDWTVLAGTILAIVNYACLSASVVHGLGRRTRFVSFARRRTAMQLLFIGQIFWYWSVTLIKLSVAFLLLRVKHTRRWKIFLYSTMLVIVLAAVIQTCFQFLQCRPFSVYWDPRVFKSAEGGVKCFPKEVINGNIVAFSAVQVSVDLMFSFIPITFIRKLHLPRREKIFMCVLMALGVFASCAAVIRTSTLQSFYTTGDLFRTNVVVSLWAVVEQQFALIAAIIPTLKSFLEKALIKIGVFFYDAETETQVRGRLVGFGLLGEDEEIERPRMARKPSKPENLARELETNKKTRKTKEWDAFGETELDVENEKDVEKMLERMAI